MVQLNCRNFKCTFNKEGSCRLESITLQPVDSLLIDKLICVEAERKPTGRPNSKSDK
ncbi:hypothetical protein LCGC14_1353550 [marine sediment metagenome]|uniref:DUF1540 domain-containing protein n=1 Tax=marine sediment metagenome TaxID=412755 RepID=A0A0F9KAS3_9ZZZZ